MRRLMISVIVLLCARWGLCLDIVKDGKAAATIVVFAFAGSRTIGMLQARAARFGVPLRRSVSLISVKN